MQPRTTLVGGLTTLWPNGFAGMTLSTNYVPETMQSRAARQKAVRVQCREIILSTLTKEGRKTGVDLSKYCDATKNMVDKILLELVTEGLISRSRKGNRASPYFYEIKRND